MAAAASTARVEVTFPKVMKIEHTSILDIDGKSTLAALNEKIYGHFWDVLLEKFKDVPKHGSSNAVQLMDKDVEITTDAELQKRLVGTAKFQAIFKVDH